MKKKNAELDLFYVTFLPSSGVKKYDILNFLARQGTENPPCCFFWDTRYIPGL